MTRHRSASPFGYLVLAREAVNRIASVGVLSVLAGPPVAAAESAPAPPQTKRIVLARGLTPVPDHRATVRAIPPPVTPDGFRPLFNGKDLEGWHISKSSNHGTTPLIVVREGMIIATQNPSGRGGLLVTNEMFGDFELYVEAKSDWGNDSGILFRATEAGAGYQVTLDTLPCGSVGLTEGVGGVRMAYQTPTLGNAPPCPERDAGLAAWKRDEWNVIRITVRGTAPRVTVTLNGAALPAMSDNENRAVGGMTRGPLALQIHGGTKRWQAGGFWRWRSIAIKELAENER